MTQKRVACLLANGFEDSEFKVPYDKLRQSGYVVDVVGMKKGEELTGKAGKEKITTTMCIDECSPVNFLAVLIPGGKSPTELCGDPRFISFVKEFDASGKPMAAICHGPQLFIKAGLARGRTMTAYKAVQEEARQAGATVVDQAVASDANWITSRTPEDLPKFVEAMIMQFDSNANQSWMARGDIHPQDAARQR